MDHVPASGEGASELCLVGHIGVGKSCLGKCKCLGVWKRGAGAAEIEGRSPRWLFSVGWLEARLPG